MSCLVTGALYIMKWSITPINKNRPNSIKRGRLERLQGILRDETSPVVLCTVLCSMVLCSTISPLASFHAPSLTDDYRITPFFFLFMIMHHLQD